MHVRMLQFSMPGVAAETVNIGQLASGVVQMRSRS
jgi:hypothetical protein